MNTKIKKYCPNCSQFFSLKLYSKQNAENVPLFLQCGHSTCENCVTNLVKFEEPIECKICHKDMEIETNDIKLLATNKLKLRQLFPVNIYMLGELALEHLETKHYEANNNDDDCFLDLTAIIQATETFQGQCLECTNPTTKMCKQCATVLCEVCFNKSHKNFVIFRNHVLQNIESELSLNNCKVHTEKTLDYYCKDCTKPICMDCLVIGGEKSCKNHNLVSTQEVNEKHLEDLAEICPKVDEMYRRLTKTAVDIGHILYNIENDTASSELSQIEKEVEQSYSRMLLIIQTQKNETVNKIVELRNAEKNSLEEAKKTLAESIKNAKYVLNSVKKSLSVEKITQGNMSLLLEDAKKVLDSPWYLSQNEADLEISVNEELCNTLSKDGIIQLEGETKCTFQLLTTDKIDPNVEIPPPPVAPVFPPELPKDVRVKKVQNKANVEKDNAKSQTFYTKAPTYHSKSASVSSLNSLNSDSSYKSSNNNRDDGLYKPVHQVSPYQENHQPRPLCAGGQELVYISHIVSPHNFYVQRVIQMPKLEDLIKEFRNAVSMPKPSVNSIAEGKSYLVFNKTDNLWQRCRVTRIDRKDTRKHLYHVFCIDFGSTEVVTIDKLRLLAPARAQTPFPFAINCSLANCEPLAGAWSSDDALLIQNITDNKQAVVHIQRVRSHADSVSLECDVTTYEAGVSLAHALAFQGRARLCNRNAPYPKNINAGQKPKLFINNNDYKLKTVEEVYITSITSPDHFYVRKVHLQSVYEKLCEDLDQNYNLNVKTGCIYLPEKDMVCVVNLEKYTVPDANTSEMVRWARAVVTELPGRGRVRLSLPDCGATLVAHWTALRRIAPNFTTLQALSTECHLAGVTPLNKTWSPNSVALLHTYRGRALDLHVDDNRNLSLAVTLYDKTEPELVCVNTEMIKYKFAVTIGTFMFNKKNVLQDCVITNKLPIDREKSPDASKKPNKIKVLKKTEELPKCTVKKETLEAKDKGPLRLEAKVLYYQSPSLIYLSLVHQQKTFNALFENIQKHYSKKKSQGKRNWKVGDKCCAVCRQSQTWRRATVLDLQGEDAKIFYSDFACVETVPVTTLRELTQEFAAIGYAAMKCHLSGVVSADGEDWPSLTKEYLKELIDAYKRVFITKMGNFKDMSMPIEMWVYHTIQGSALEPNTSEWRCLNKKIIEQGLGIPDKSQQLEMPSDKADTPDDMLSFLNVKGSIEDWLQLEPMPKKPLVVPSDADRSNSSTPECEINFNDDKTNKPNTVFISNWMPPEPLQNKEFVGVPTYVDNDGIIYVHEVTQEETLEMIQKALDVRFKKADPKAKYASWSVGEPCVAMYYLDNKFYRGRVLQVNKEASTCLVHYIDYGNDEICNFSNLRKSIALYQLPTQAIKCILNRVEPVDKFWDRKTLDYIHVSIVEKKCYIKVTGDPIDGIYPVEITCNKLLFNDHLVEFEMAKYCDGSKAVIRRFAPDNRQIELDESATIESDSAPDYIIEEDDIESANDSYCMESLQGKDWNLLIQEEKEKQMLSGKFLSFTKNTIENFICNITVINDFKCFELFILHDETIVKEYEEMFEKLQEVATDMPPLNGIFENKACLAIFNEDGQWYRASILQYSTDTNEIKVRYVDYGNIELVTLADVREIDNEFINLPPLTVTATLHDVQINPAIGTSVIAEEYKNTFLDKGPFQVKVIDDENDIPSVELRNDKSELVYEHLIENNTFLRFNNE